MVVQGSDLAYAAAVRQSISKFMDSLPGCDVNDFNAQKLLGGLALVGVLDQRGLDDADQSFAVRRDGQAFHPLVGGAAAFVAADFVRADRAQIADKQVRGQLEGTGPPSGRALKL